ncbi:MAG: hypothetical protein WD733_02300 [Bryobacterales bacterium]
MITFLPFAPGGYDSMAVPLAAMAWVLGRVGLLLVPIGLLWLWALSRDRPARPRWLIRLSVSTSAFILVVMSVIAFAASGSLLLATGTATGVTLLIARLARHLRRHLATPLPRMVPALITVAPIFVLAVQTMLVDAAATHARDRVIANAAPLIEEIERYRTRRGTYPESLFSIWGDYKPSIVGVERYHYERSGDGYNVIFREPSLDFGMRRFVAYNPLDRQRVTVHETDRLLLDEAGLDADNAGYTVVRALPQPHWKLFVFLS